jgi:DNA replication protein DnaC
VEHIGEILRRQAPADVPVGPTADSESEPASCPVCGGARFVHPLLPDGRPDYGKVVPCRCAVEDEDGKRQFRLQRYSNLGPLTRLTFDSIAPEGVGHALGDGRTRGDGEQFRRAYEAARRFADAPDGWLVLTGPSGQGKTHLAAAIANQCVARQVPAFYISVPDLLDHLRASFSPGSEIPYDDFFEQVRNAPVLVLDDVGAQSGTPWAGEKLEQLLNHRFSHRLPTVVVSIVPIDELDERLRARLTDPDLSQVVSVGSRPTALHTSSWAPWFELQKRMTFESFDSKRANLPAEQRQNLETAYRLARDFAASPDGWLVFQGVNGCGKTHLAAAIVNRRFEHGQPALFIVVPDFLDHLRSTFSPESKIPYDQLFESVRSTPLLVLDDFGEQATTPWAQEKLYQVINHRYNARLATVITTSSSLDEIESRISSRLADPKISVLFNITAPDYRGDLRSPRRRPARRG